MWSALAFLLLLQHVFIPAFGGIFIPIHGYEKTVQKREPSPFAAACWQMLRNADASVALGQRRDVAYGNVPGACFALLQQEK
ncbi:hypothetical protein QR680_009231 [Steinernema hermaphroditum]|uniref:Secreted protein n=1 Tax=Steinernema hermaphroditum TaxID=289476 RepID=A0AA39ILX0_9BILA|nr:hypothetical protein QR680_009231 [Steinernema hermaphroditum]